MNLASSNESLVPDDILAFHIMERQGKMPQKSPLEFIFSPTKKSTSSLQNKLYCLPMWRYLRKKETNFLNKSQKGVFI